ncbi:other scy1 protein kinase [Moniliophthora roreri MCA 2997]|uniref:Other scy1 protein kinase n=1 Tax=Moniliophthora roreri (strain MCA 2997) TaxID=1381753 RepID=V2XW77_MONRO|nr:other scy1 protein kinase [Moniliophthora roreri MCA 2997]
MFAAATSFFGRTAISQSYNIGGNPSSNPASRSSTPGPQSPGPSSSTFGSSFSPSLAIGLWKVQSATHKVTNKRVSIWSFDKRGPDMERLSPNAKERTLEVLKAEATSLSRLRHPSILEMVEPLEETRNELIFATEPLLASLELAIPGSGKLASLVELDEVEIQKGILQVCKGLSFLHSSAQLIHSNLCPESIIINQSGDWKIAGLGLTIPLLQPNGSPTGWEFPTFDGRVPAYIQRSFDYMAPEYVLDEVLNTASDMYSLGCVMYTVHSKGSPPFKTHGSLSGLRDNAGKTPAGLERLDKDLQALLRSTITRHPAGRPTPTSLPTHSFFSSLPISTLNFLDRSNFTAKTREEKVSFMKGLATVLDKFSEGLKTRKILPSLLEEMKDTHLLPYILPNVFTISSTLSSSQFAAMVLPSLKPLFGIKEPPTNMLTLLDNLPMLQSKTDKLAFKTDVLPLVYNALESEHAVVQEKALKMVPNLCETIDYAEVQGVLFPRVALVFTKTRILSVKVATLVTFLAMVKTLDQSSLTQKLVPLLSKIRTKEPAVMMATLSVQEAMGFKVDREAVATLVLPQLWAMSMGPLLNLDQFQRFMSVIRKLGERVEKEHNQFLRDSQRLEDRSAMQNDGAANIASFSGNVDFESLVGRNASAGGETNGVEASGSGKGSSWDDDVWGSIFNETSSPAPSTPVLSASQPSIQPSKRSASMSPSVTPAQPSRLGAAPTATPSSLPAFTTFSSPGLGTSTSSSTISSPTTFTLPAPQRYNQPTLGSTKPNVPMGMLLPQQSSFSSPILPSTPTPPMMGGMLTPSNPQTRNITSSKPSKDDWGDFDPLS